MLPDIIFIISIDAPFLMLSFEALLYADYAIYAAPLLSPPTF